MTKRGHKRIPSASTNNDVGARDLDVETPAPLIPGLSHAQRQLEAAVESPLAEFLAMAKALPAFPMRLLLILFEYRWTVPLLGEREFLAQAIQSMERAFELRDQGFSIKDLDSLDEIWCLIGSDRKKRRADVVRQRQAEIAKQGLDGNRRKGNETRARVIAKAIAMKNRNPRLSKNAAAKAIANLRRAPCKFDQARKILNGPFAGDPWKNKVG
jgi:hypothetical protein